MAYLVHDLKSLIRPQRRAFVSNSAAAATGMHSAIPVQMAATSTLAVWWQPLSGTKVNDTVWATESGLEQFTIACGHDWA